MDSLSEALQEPIAPFAVPLAVILILPPPLNHGAGGEGDDTRHRGIDRAERRAVGFGTNRVGADGRVYGHGADR